MTGRSNYLSYLLRLWLAGDDGEAVWHASLDDPLNGERLGFPTLDELFSFLRNQATTNGSTENSDKNLTLR